MFVDNPEMTEALTTRDERIKQSEGFYMKWVRLWGWVPEIEEAFRMARGKLDETTTLTKRERFVIVVASVSKLGDAYCSLAWGKMLANLTEPAIPAAIVKGADTATMTDRERALATWARKVVAHPSGTTKEDVDAMRAAGLTQKEIVEATTLVAFRVAFSMVNGALGAGPDIGLKDSAPPALVESVTYGRPAH
jgi:uncharacterized peroxidase-related enzyme